MGKLEKSLLLNMQVPVAGIVAKIPNMASITDPESVAEDSMGWETNGSKAAAAEDAATVQDA